MKPKVTVVVCTYNDENTIGPVLDALTRLRYEPREIMVVDDASTDRTSAVISRYPVTVLQNKQNQGLGYNQNLALRLADGDYLALVQSDCVVASPEWLDEMTSLMEGKVGVVVSQREIHDFASLPAGARLFNAVAPQDLRNGSGGPLEIEYCRGKADLYRLSTLRELGGWNTSFFTAGEDTDLSIRIRKAGYRILLHPTARVHYLFSGRQSTVSGALKKAFLYGRVATILYRLYRYDGIQSRTYLTLLLSCVALMLPHSVQAVAGAALFIYAFSCRIQTRNGGSVPFSVLALFASLPLFVLNFPNYLQDVVLLPARSLVLAGAAYTGYLAAKNTYNNVKKGEQSPQIPKTFLFCIAWRMISGIGYIAGVYGSLRRSVTESKALEKHESLID